VCDGDDAVAVAVLEVVFDDGKMGLRKNYMGVRWEENVHSWW
jgi:hypothetical protein